MSSREKEMLYRAELIIGLARSLAEEIKESGHHTSVVTVDRRSLHRLIHLAEWNAETVINDANESDDC